MARTFSQVEKDYLGLVIDMNIDLSRQLTHAYRAASNTHIELAADVADENIAKAIATIQAMHGYLLAVKGFRPIVRS